MICVKSLLNANLKYKLNTIVFISFVCAYMGAAFYLIVFAALEKCSVLLFQVRRKYQTLEDKSGQIKVVSPRNE